jgi:archaellum component FlaG (FlaF/FlaG flagellin family)
MRNTNPFKLAGLLALVAAVALAIMMNSSKTVRASQNDAGENEESEIQRGFDVAPVPLNLEHKNRALVA